MNPCWGRRKLNSAELEAGSATIWAVGFICLLTALAVGIGLLNGIFVAKVRAQSGADFAALAAAQTHFFGGTNTPCSAAEKVALENQVSLVTCSLHTSEVRVEVNVKTLSNWEVKAHSRAGPALSKD
ncbi:Rv3654c family TadE-like protein [Varibaculum vaginae]|uniref:Rv3654c family TadE-like protein n=1 Tax=Varibaculum vaginae TaxID=2364797 RepID=UPI000F07517A|nr:Rv3654c family TadE-like protein [Varibaculum vaginae]